MFFAAVAVMAAGSFAAGTVASADAVISPGDLQPAAADQELGHLFAGAVVKQLHRRPGDLHLSGAFFLSHILQIDEADGFIFLHIQEDGGIMARSTRRKSSPPGGGRRLVSIFLDVPWEKAPRFVFTVQAVLLARRADGSAVLPPLPARWAKNSFC